MSLSRDGSQLILNAGTYLRVQNDFSGARRVELVDGEVFFDELNNLSIGVLSGKVSVASR